MIKVDKSNDRGKTKIGWLDSKHSFNFGDYYKDDNDGFGKLLVLNDDIIAPGQGFGTHPHRNMEIITVMLKGLLGHKDSTGKTATLTPEWVQVMSAGKGIMHSEFNGSDKIPLELLQIWIHTKENNIEPRHEERKYDERDYDEQLRLLVSGKKSDDVLYIHQDAYITRGNISSVQTYKIKNEGNLAYVFIISGSATINGMELKERDAARIIDESKVGIEPKKKTDLIIIEIPR